MGLSHIEYGKNRGLSCILESYFIFVEIKLHLVWFRTSCKSGMPSPSLSKSSLHMKNFSYSLNTGFTQSIRVLLVVSILTSTLSIIVVNTVLRLHLIWAKKTKVLVWIEYISNVYVKRKLITNKPPTTEQRYCSLVIASILEIRPYRPFSHSKMLHLLSLHPLHRKHLSIELIIAVNEPLRHLTHL